MRYKEFITKETIDRFMSQILGTRSSSDFSLPTSDTSTNLDATPASNVINDFDVKLKHLKESFALASKNRVTNRLIEKIDTQIKELVEESKNIASSDIIKNNNQIKTKFKNSLQELNNMTRRRNSILAENYASLVRGLLPNASDFQGLRLGLVYLDNTHMAS